MSYTNPQNTICPLSTAPGMGAIAVIRMSGKNAVKITDKVFHGKKKISEAEKNTVHYGSLKDGNRIVDEVVVTFFKGPHSFTGEDTIEISCHGSPYIQQQIVQLLIKNGAESAGAGEFTLRAFMNGKMDLSQAEAVADLIASDSEASHKLAMQQMRGGFSKEIQKLREDLIEFASLIELELDFSEEDVEFADRDDLKGLVTKIQKTLTYLIDSFNTGNVLKNGVPVAITGEPNVGKSTLLNVLLNEERAIVSDIAGTTRDVIEDQVNINGITYRFIDTAGIRQTEDSIETMGIEKTYEKIDQAAIILYLVDAVKSTRMEIEGVVNSIKSRIEGKNKKLVVLANKVDLDKEKDISAEISSKFSHLDKEEVVYISAKDKLNIDKVTGKLSSYVKTGALSSSDVMVTNTRHYEALSKSNEALQRVLEGLENNITGDFLAMDIRQALQHLGSITGEITTDDLLDNIFSNFCIGK